MEDNEGTMLDLQDEVGRLRSALADATLRLEYAKDDVAREHAEHIRYKNLWNNYWDRKASKDDVAF